MGVVRALVRWAIYYLRSLLLTDYLYAWNGFIRTKDGCMGRQ